MIKAALIGLGKMGISHMSVINAHPDFDLVAVCDTVPYVLDVLKKYTGKRVYSDFKEMLDKEDLEAVFIATPSKLHADMVGLCLDRGLHVFCEKPFVLDPTTGAALAARAKAEGRVGQVGYHYRFVGSFAEMKRLLDHGTLGQVHHVRSEAYGPVVLREKGSTWRSSKSEGGGCLYDYACHAIDLMNHLVGAPQAVAAAQLNSIFSRDVNDEVYASFEYGNGLTGTVNANWSDESLRKMSTKVKVWGTNGRIVADRQEIQVYLRDPSLAPHGYSKGWNIKYTTDLTAPVWFYLRGEEYSAQIDYFAESIKTGRVDGLNNFESAAIADRVAAAIVVASEAARTSLRGEAMSIPKAAPKSRSFLGFGQARRTKA